MTVTAAQIDKLLPQTQCRDCSYDSCFAYAQAIAEGKEDIDRCHPGGTETLHALARLTQHDAKPFIEEVKNNFRQAEIAIIREDECIGCTKCIRACPVDAIIGSGKQMHSIIADECTGCRLCVDRCPVDCIDMLSIASLDFDKDKARLRYNHRIARQEQNEIQDQTAHQNSVNIKIDERKLFIQAALKRAKKNKQHNRDREAAITKNE